MKIKRSVWFVIYFVLAALTVTAASPAGAGWHLIVAASVLFTFSAFTDPAPRAYKVRQRKRDVPLVEWVKDCPPCDCPRCND